MLQDNIEKNSEDFVYAELLQGICSLFMAFFKVKLWGSSSVSFLFKEVKGITYFVTMPYSQHES